MAPLDPPGRAWTESPEGSVPGGSVDMGPKVATRTPQGPLRQPQGVHEDPLGPPRGPLMGPRRRPRHAQEPQEGPRESP